MPLRSTRFIRNGNDALPYSPAGRDAGNRLSVVNSRVIFGDGNWPGFHLSPALWAVLGHVLFPFIVDPVMKSLQIL